MKTSCLNTFATLLSLATLSTLASAARAQEAAATQPAPAYAPAPQVGYGVSQVLQLQQANVGDDTIITYIKNSGNSYALNAEQIIYLRQQGVSGAVLNTMLTQPATAVAYAVPSQESVVAAPVYVEPVVYGYQYQPQASIVGPSVSGIDPSAAASAISYNCYRASYIPPYYSYYTPFYPAYGIHRISIGGRSGFHGGFHGGWHH